MEGWRRGAAGDGDESVEKRHKFSSYIKYRNGVRSHGNGSKACRVLFNLCRKQVLTVGGTFYDFLSQ